MAIEDLHGYKTPQGLHDQVVVVGQGGPRGEFCFPMLSTAVAL